MKRVHRRLTLIAAGLLALVPVAQGAVPPPTAAYLVTVNTSSVTSETGAIDLQFNAGALTSETACVTISNFSTDGTLGSPAATTGNVTGTLATSLTIDNGGGACTPANTYTASTVNDYHQPITFGTTISFFIALNSPVYNGSTTSGSSFGLAFTLSGSAALTSDPSNFAGTITLNQDGSFTPTALAGPNGGPSLVAIQGAELVTVGTSISGLSFTVDTDTYTSSQTFPFVIGSTHTLSTTTQGSNGTRYTPTGWSDGTTTATDAITVSTGTTSYTANFATSYLLTTAANPKADGSVGVNTLSPTGDGYYLSGTPLMLTGTPANSGYSFANWTGTEPTSSTNPLPITMSGPVSETANFVANNVNVTINTSPQGLLVSVDNGTAQAAPVHVTWQLGTNHTIATTSPQGSNGTRYTFTGWSDEGALSHQVTASASTPSYTASFSTSYLLTTSLTPSGSGTVTPASGTYYASGTVVNLKASPNAGYVFENWSGSVAKATAASTTVTMSEPRTVTANFGEGPTSLTGYLTTKSGTLAARKWIFSIINNGPGAANAAEITSLKLTQTSGKACTPVITTPLPISLGNLSPSESISTTVDLDFASCARTPVFRVNGTLTANGGKASGVILVTGQEP